MHLNEAPHLVGGRGVSTPVVVSSTEAASPDNPSPHPTPHPTGGLRGEVKISAAQRDDHRAAPKLSGLTADTWACVGIIVLE